MIGLTGLILQFATAQNMTSFTNMFLYANDVTGNWFGLLIVFSMLIICVLSLTTLYNFKTGLAVGSFFTFIISSFLMGAGLVGEVENFVIVIICAGSVMWLWLSG